MEQLHVAIVYCFDLISVLMPYYDYTHEMFLLLSSLCKCTRQKLNSRYEEFRRIMLKFSSTKEINIRDLSELNFPLDLFKLKINKASLNIGGENLITFANSLMDRKGCYFGEHYMNDLICMSRMYIDAKYIKDLVLYTSLLSSIKIIESFCYACIQSQSSSLLDLIVLYGGSIFSYQGNKQRICYFKDFKCKEIDPIFKQFKIISEIRPKNIEDAIVKLNLLKQSNITEIEHLNFNNLDPDDLKEVVNLDYLNCKLKSLRYNSQDCDLLNDQVYENISLINLQKLYLSGLSSISNSLRVLSNLPYDTTIDLASSSPEFFNLKFTKLELLFQSKQSLFRLSCKEVIFKFNDDLEQEDIVLLGGNIICISLFKEMGIRKITKEYITANSESESSNFINSEGESHYFISQANLSEIKLTCKQILILLKNKNNSTYFSLLSSSKKVIIELKSMEDVLDIDEVSEYIPKHSELEFECSINENKKKVKKSFDAMIFSKTFTEFKLRSFSIKGKRITGIVMYILSDSYVKNSLKHLECRSCSPSECLSIMSMCSGFKLLETLDIKCYAEGIEDYKEKIMEAEDKIRYSSINIQRINIDCKYISYYRYAPNYYY